MRLGRLRSAIHRTSGVVFISVVKTNSPSTNRPNSSDLILHCRHRVLNGGAYLQAPNADWFTVAFLPPKHKSIAVQQFQQGRIEFITARTLEKVIRVKRNCFSSTVMNFLL